MSFPAFLRRKWLIKKINLQEKSPNVRAKLTASSCPALVSLQHGHIVQWGFSSIKYQQCLLLLDSYLIPVYLQPQDDFLRNQQNPSLWSTQRASPVKLPTLIPNLYGLSPFQQITGTHPSLQAVSEKLQSRFQLGMYSHHFTNKTKLYDVCLVTTFNLT